MSNGSSQNHRITLEKAKKMAKKFKDNRDRINIPDQPVSDLLPISETFSRDAFDALLAQPDCQSVRIYYSMDDDLKVHAIVVGVDGNDRDIISSASSVSSATTTTDTTSATTLDDPVIIEDARRCPPNCPSTSGFGS